MNFATARGPGFKICNSLIVKEVDTWCLAGHNFKKKEELRSMIFSLFCVAPPLGDSTERSLTLSELLIENRP